MLDINDHYKEKVYKFEKELRDILSPLNLSAVEETSIIGSIRMIYLEHLREESDYLFDAIEERLTSVSKAGEQNR